MHHFKSRFFAIRTYSPNIDQTIWVENETSGIILKLSSFSSDFDLCTPNPCRNGGNCINTTDSYYCECPTSYTGYDCTDGKKLIISIFFFFSHMIT